MCRWKFELVLYSSPSEGISNKLFDGYQSNLSDSNICWYSWIYFLVNVLVMIPQVDPNISVGIKISADASITNFMTGSFE